MSEKTPIVLLERDFANDYLRIKREDGTIETVQAEQLKGRVSWDEETRKARVSYALKDLAVVDG